MAEQRQQGSLRQALEAWIKKNFAAPVFPNSPDKTLKAGQVNIILNSGMASMFIFALLEVIVHPQTCCKPKANYC